MPGDKLIEASELKWKVSSKYTDVIGAIQITYSNGVSSPVFLGKDQNENDLKSVVFNSQIKKIRGSINSDWIRYIHFQDKDGKEISRF